MPALIVAGSRAASQRYFGSSSALPKYPVRPAGRFPNSNQQFSHTHTMGKEKSDLAPLFTIDPSHAFGPFLTFLQIFIGEPARFRFRISSILHDSRASRSR